jgi:peptidoglycan endopeptidase LytE
LQIERYSAHAFVLAIAVVFTGYIADPDRHFVPPLARLGAVDAQAVVVNQEGSVGDVSLGRYSTIIKPVAIPIAPVPSHRPFSYSVEPGESLVTIAAKFKVTVSQIRWSNSNLTSSEAVVPGQTLVIPPVPGIAVSVKTGDTLESLASAYQVDPSSIADYNRLRKGTLVAGTVLVIPDGVGPAFPPPPARYLARSLGAMPTVVVSCCLGPYATTFPLGWCTYLPATKRVVTWNGNAGDWYVNAQAQGYAVGPTPKVGAIMVTWESYLGHVAYVESVNPDGSWTVSEMNYVGFNVMDLRTIKPGQLGTRLIGFIY